MHFDVDAGKYDRPSGPVRIAAPEGKWNPGDILALDDVQSDGKVPCQIDSRGRLCWILPPMKAGEKRAYKLDPRGVLGDGPRVTIDETHPGEVQIWAAGKHVTSYCFAPDLPRPFLYPMLTPSGRALTRNFPMRTDVANEKKDHPHHRSCWVAHGNINGMDYWMEKKDPKEQAKQVHRRFETNVSGQVFGQVKALIDWNRPDGSRLITEQRTYVVYPSDKDFTLIDMTVQLLLSEEDLTFGDTKEGGICSVRVGPTIDETGGGRMINSEGQQGEKECWGKKAKWVDYCGQVDGKPIGLTLMDAPTNFRHPTPWHARGYGLLTANPFGLGAFTNKKEDGTQTWKKGETLVWNYRLMLHHDDTKTIDVAGHYANFAEPPAVTIR
jgi:hypothetical protein